MILSIEQIKKTVADYFKDKPVKKVYLFGSYARGEAGENSDLDLLIDMDAVKGLGWSVSNWGDEIEKETGCKTDVISNVQKPQHTSNWRFIERINKEKVLLYERA